MTLIEAKSAARKSAFMRRKSAHSTKDHCAKLLDVLADHRGKIISGYMPIRTEIDPRPAMHALARNNRICVPVIVGAGQPLVFHEWTPQGTMVDGPFGAQVPAVHTILTPDILIVPLLAFDDACFRLGYGGGFYDRTLEGLRAKGATTAYGFAYAAQYMTEIPTEQTDQPLDGVITETSLLLPK